MSEYSETSQLRTRCTILESQIHALSTKNAKLQERIEQLENSSTKQSKEEVPTYKDGKFPHLDDHINYDTLVIDKDDGSFAI